MSVQVIVSCERTTGPGKVCGDAAQFKTIEDAKASGWFILNQSIAVCPKHTTWLEMHRNG